MSAEKKYTEREKVIAEQDAYMAAIENAIGPISDHTRAFYRKNAATRFPLPKVTRARVVQDTNGRQFRVADDQIETRHPDHKRGEWLCAAKGWLVTDGGRGLSLSAHRVRLLADLLANPTEEVEG